MFLIFFFFFQAEDGIRDGHVTGVQTCALPIFEFSEPLDVLKGDELTNMIDEVAQEERYTRSEERRVGKEGRSRWWPAKRKKKEEQTRGGSDGEQKKIRHSQRAARQRGVEHIRQ